MCVCVLWASYGEVGDFEHVDDIVEVANGNELGHLGHLMVEDGGKLVHLHEVTQMMLLNNVGMMF